MLWPVEKVVTITAVPSPVFKDVQEKKMDSSSVSHSAALAFDIKLALNQTMCTSAACPFLGGKMHYFGSERVCIDD